MAYFCRLKPQNKWVFYHFSFHRAGVSGFYIFMLYTTTSNTSAIPHCEFFLFIYFLLPLNWKWKLIYSLRSAIGNCIFASKFIKVAFIVNIIVKCLRIINFYNNPKPIYNNRKPIENSSWVFVEGDANVRVGLQKYVISAVIF